MSDEIDPATGKPIIDETRRLEVLRQVVSGPDPDEIQMADILAKKTGVMVAIPNMESKITTPLALWLIQLSYRTVDAECPWFFKIYVPNDLTPIEWARNQCVREFLRDPYYKRLWFVDSDMLPPGNALELLDHDDPIVSGMSYIWSSENVDAEGFYRPPYMKINAFNYRPEHQDFMSLVPERDGRAFYCDAAGCAFMVIRRELLEDMPEPWFRYPRDPYGRGLRGEDMDFCLRVKELGGRVLYIPKVQVGHIKPTDLKQVVNYGIATMRETAEGLRKIARDKVHAALQKIRFPGEKPAKEDEAVRPLTLAVVEGGKG